MARKGNTHQVSKTFWIESTPEGGVKESIVLHCLCGWRQVLPLEDAPTALAKIAAHFDSVKEQR